MGSISGTAIAVLLAASPAAADPFDGVWKIDSMKRSPRTEVMVIKDGTFQCGSCMPPFSVPADGAFHAVAGQGNLDEIAVTAVDPRTMREINKVKGRVVRDETITLAADGASAVLAFTDTINPGVAPVTGRETLTRLAAGPSGSLPLSGSWRPEATTDVSEHALTQTMRIDDDVLTMRTGEGFGYVAKLDGTPAPASGDPFVDTVSVRRVGQRELQEVDSHQGTPLATFTITVSPDRSVLTTTWRNERSGRVTSTTAHRM